MTPPKPINARWSAVSLWLVVCLTLAGAQLPLAARGPSTRAVHLPARAVTVGESPIDTYARAVLEGSVPAGKYHRLACARHERDRAREGTAAFPYRFDRAKAERFFRFAAKLKHYKGEWAGQFIVLQPWQQFRLGSIVGWVHVDTGLRRFRTAYNEVPRKNGKSLEAAIIAVYITFFDGEPGAEGYCLATQRSQAMLVFRDAKKLVQSSGLKAHLTIMARNLHRVDTASKLEPLGANPEDGLNPSFICIDEFHKLKTRDLLDVMETATGARRQPLNFQITTAGDDPVSPCGDQHDYACKILDQILSDETFFAFIAHADVGDDWTLESTAQKANPNWGVSIKPDDLQALVTKALHIPQAAAAYQQKRLNLWVNTDAPWLSIDGWRQGQSSLSSEVFAAELAHESCWVGVDLASSIDLCAMVAVFPPSATHTRWRLRRWVWTPRDTLLERQRRDRAPYVTWAEQGFLIPVDGVRLNQTVIRDVLRTLRTQVKIEQIGFDPWHADQVVDDLIDEDGFDKDQVVLVPQTYAGMSKAALEYEASVLEGVVDANGCPLMAWCHANAVVQRDGKDNIYPVKKKSRGRIDPLMATIIGWRLAQLGQKTRRASKGARIWTPSGWVPAIPPKDTGPGAIPSR